MVDQKIKSLGRFLKRVTKCMF